MEPSPKRAPLAGGFVIALTTLVGAFVGALQRQPSLGLVIGLGAGALLALGIWLLDRR